MAADDRSVAPKERVNIVYKSAVDGAQADVELPMKQLVIGDFTQRESDTPLEDRHTVTVDKENFNEVLKAQGLELQFAVPDRLDEKAGKDDALAVSLSFSQLSDFEPDAIAGQVPELRALVQLRDALRALKGPLGNLPEFRKRLQEIVKDEAARDRLLGELGVERKDRG
jgi:type VI secretion system protein ImpB